MTSNAFTDKLLHLARSGEPIVPHLEALAGELTGAERALYHPLLLALGASAEVAGPDQRQGYSQADRLALWRAFLGYLALDRCVPAWSSHLLERGVRSLATTGPTAINDAFRAAFALLGDGRCDWSPVLRTFLLDLVRTFAANDRASLARVDLAEIAPPDTLDSMTSAQAYLCWMMRPPGALEPRYLKAVLARLAGSDAWPELATELGADLEEIDPADELGRWVPDAIELDDRQRSELAALLAGRGA